MREVAFFRYREHFHLSFMDAIEEPVEEIERAILIWSLDDKRGKLESERQNNN
jgi:hypothetical protein